MLGQIKEVYENIKLVYITENIITDVEFKKCKKGRAAK
jgi:hypothetical protein